MYSDLISQILSQSSVNLHLRHYRRCLFQDKPPRVRKMLSMNLLHPYFRMTIQVACSPKMKRLIQFEMLY